MQFALLVYESLEALWHGISTKPVLTSVPRGRTPSVFLWATRPMRRRNRFESMLDRKSCKTAFLESPNAILDVSLDRPTSTRKQKIFGRRLFVFRRRRFYRGSFGTRSLRTLWSRIPLSVSCNVALTDSLLYVDGNRNGA